MNQNFFTDYLLNPFSNEISETDQKICLAVSIALGFLTLGFLHLGFAIYNWSQRNVIDQTPKPAEDLPPFDQGEKKAEKEIDEIDKALENTLKGMDETDLGNEVYLRIKTLANQIVYNAKQLIVECAEETELRSFILKSTKDELSSLITAGQGTQVDESFNKAQWVQNMTSAARYGKKEDLVKEIGKRPYDINHRAPIWLNGTVLHHLAKIGRCTELVDVLASSEIDFDIIDNQGNTAIMWAIANGNNSMADQMLDYEQNLDILCYGNTALHLVIAKGYKDITYSGASLTVSNFQLMQKIIQNKADVHKFNTHGLTALHIACIRRDPDMIQALLDAGADPKTKTEGGESCAELLELSYEEATKKIRKITPPFLLPEEDFNNGYENSLSSLSKYSTI